MNEQSKQPAGPKYNLVVPVRTALYSYKSLLGLEMIINDALEKGIAIPIRLILLCLGIDWRTLDADTRWRCSKRLDFEIFSDCIAFLTEVTA